MLALNGTKCYNVFMLVRQRVPLCARPAVLVAACGFLIGALFVGAACTPADASTQHAIVYSSKIAQPARMAGAPDVQVLVLSNLSGIDQVNITYPTVVPRTQVDRDVDMLGAVSSWPIGGIQVTNTALPLSGVRTLPMTSVSFAAQGPVHKQQKGFWLEPFVVALRGYKQLTITYMVPRNFAFAGLHKYSNDHVHISLTQHGSVYTYNVSVDNPNFQRLNLPIIFGTQAASDQRAGAASSAVQQAAVPRRARSVRALRVVGVLLVGALAALVGFAVYAVLSRMS